VTTGSRQRNNLCRLPPEVRTLASRLVFEGGLTYRQIAEQVANAAGGGVKIHNNTLLAWQRSAEYRRYVAAREKYDAELGESRAVAAAVNDGRGPSSLADLVVMDILRELRQAQAAGSLDLSDLARVSQAVAPILRNQVAAEKLATDRRLADAEAAHAEALAARDAEIARLREEIARLRNDGRQVDAAAVADRMDEVLGVKKA